MPATGPGLLEYLLTLVAGYFIGAIPTAYWLCKKKYGIDIREHGSGNAGATNVKRVVGGKPAIVVLLFDFLKSLVPVMIAKTLFPGAYWLHVALAAATVIGHSKSIFIGFTGGKSAATGLGGVVGLSPAGGLILAALAFVIIKVGRIVSLGSITAGLCGPFVLYLVGAPMPYVIYIGVMSLYVIILHKGNIQRLLSGTENRI